MKMSRRVISAAAAHPDHDTICAFRVQNANLFQESFVKVLEWSLVTLAYNFRRLARLIPAATTRCHGDFALQTAY